MRTLSSFIIFVCIFVGVPAYGQSVDDTPNSLPASLPHLPWHLTARPWEPEALPRSEILNQMETAVRAMVPLQYWNQTDAKDPRNGAIIDPFDHKEVQYGTPLFAFNITTLYQDGRAEDLLEAGARALDRSTLDISDGPATDWHGEFFCAAMVKAIRVYRDLAGKHPSVTAERLAMWEARMKSPRSRFFNMKVKQNWRTFAMKGEWLRGQDGYIDDAEEWIEANWNLPQEGQQRERFRRDLDKHGLKPNFFFYHDDTASPETFAYNGATTANLLDFLESGYQGSSANEMRDIIYHNLKSSLFILGAAGESAGGGRTGEHIWGDSIYANAFEIMAEICEREGKTHLAGQYRRAVDLLLLSHARFQQENGWFSITKNRFPAAAKNRYASWSAIANYEGFTLSCVAETLLARKSTIEQQPTPAEIGGYALTLDSSFANTFVNAGGMQAQLCTRGETDNYGDVQWHSLGITRFSRVDWDGRLGPGAGHVNSDFSDGFSFSPVFEEDGQWKRVCLEPKRFQGRFTASFVHPLLLRGTYTIFPTKGHSGPSFDMELTLTPDGILIDTTAKGTTKFGVLCPLLAFDGRTRLNVKVDSNIASTSFPSAAGNPQVIQAEDATLTDGAEISADREDFHGNGVVKFSTKGGTVEWNNLNGGRGGDSVIGFRYSLGMGQNGVRQGKLFVNGKVQPNLDFHSTGKREFWHEAYVPVTLSEGTTNTVRLFFEDEGAVIDELRVHPANPSTLEPNEQNFIAIGNGHRLDSTSVLVRGGYGDFRPVRMTNPEGAVVSTFVYPRSAGDPQADAISKSFQRQGADFSTALGWVEGTLYAGRTSAGGYGKSIDLDRDGTDEIRFDKICNFVIQLKNGKPIAIEADRAVTATVGQTDYTLAPFVPIRHFSK